MKYNDNIKNFIDTKILDLQLGHFSINTKTVNIRTWWRHRNSDGFTIHEKKEFDNYLEFNCIDWMKYDKTKV